MALRPAVISKLYISLLYAATGASMTIVGIGSPTRFPSLLTWVRGRSAWSVTWSCGLVRSSADVVLEPRRMRPELRPARPSSLMVFKRIRDLLSSPACTWAFSVAALWVIQDHPVYIPRPATGLFVPI
jgi:hypothetical protein